MFAVLQHLQVKDSSKWSFGDRWTKRKQEMAVPGLYSEHKELNPEAFARRFQVIDPPLEVDD